MTIPRRQVFRQPIASGAHVLGRPAVFPSFPGQEETGRELLPGAFCLDRGNPLIRLVKAAMRLASARQAF